MFRSFWPWKTKKVNKITLGICAMDKKASSKPMKEILSRLPADVFEIVMYGDEMILNTPVEEWPVVEVLIAFYSSRFPTEKALEYIKLHKPFLLNDLEMDTVMRDRRKVYALLQSQGIEIPHHVFLNREPGVPDTNELEEFDEVGSISSVANTRIAY
jgi:inositol hexakisphosphate/diphosphoinositol-pentakisphosphate kinase